MYRYSWPGNIRELQSIIYQAVILATPPLVELKDIAYADEKLYQNPRKTRLSDMTYVEAKEEFEKRYFQSVSIAQRVTFHQHPGCPVWSETSQREGPQTGDCGRITGGLPKPLRA